MSTASYLGTEGSILSRSGLLCTLWSRSRSECMTRNSYASIKTPHAIDIFLPNGTTKSPPHLRTHLISWMLWISHWFRSCFRCWRTIFFGLVYCTVNVRWIKKLKVVFLISGCCSFWKHLFLYRWQYLFRCWSTNEKLRVIIFIIQWTWCCCIIWDIAFFQWKAI